MKSLLRLAITTRAPRVLAYSSRRQTYATFGAARAGDSPSRVLPVPGAPVSIYLEKYKIIVFW